MNELKENSVPERRYDLDWLRIFATIMIFLFHSARAYDYLPWEIKNDKLDIGMTIFVVFLSGWIMPFFFILSGMSVFYALKARTNKEFIKERSKRLLIPWIFGICTSLSIHVYIEVLYGQPYLPPFSGNYFEFYFFRYFTSGVYGYGGYLPLGGGIYLWYLIFLFIYSLVCLKLFRYLKKSKNKEKITKLANFCNKPGRIFIFVIPIIMMMILGYVIAPLFYIEIGGWNILVYIIFLIYGYMFASNEKFRESLEKYRILAFIIGIVTSLVIIILFLTYYSNLLQIEGLFELNEFTFSILYIIFWPLNCLCWLIAILGIGSKKLDKNRKSLKYLSDIVLPFYIIHQTIIIVVAFYCISLNIPIIAKYLIVVSVSFVIIFCLILLIRKVKVLRFLFGMRIKEKKQI